MINIVWLFYCIPLSIVKWMKSLCIFLAIEKTVEVKFVGQVHRMSSARMQIVLKRFCVNEWMKLQTQIINLSFDIPNHPFPRSTSAQREQWSLVRLSILCRHFYQIWLSNCNVLKHWVECVRVLIVPANYLLRKCVIVLTKWKELNNCKVGVCGDYFKLK